MAEVVGLVASVLQLVDTVASAHRYLKDFRDAPKDQRRLLGEAAGMISGLQEFEEPLLQLKATMERLTQKLNSKASNRVTWPLWGKGDIEEGLSTIERFKSLLNAWLGMDLWKSGQDITSSIQVFAEEQRTDHSYIMRSVKHLVQENREAHNQTISSLKDATEDLKTDHTYIAKSIRDLARNQEHVRESAERAEIIEWLSPLNFFLRQADILSTRQPGTGEWLLKDQLFRNWKSRMGNTVWCRGMPGAGKTVLASIVVDNLRTTLESQSIGVAVIYLNHKETEAQSPSNLLTGLWRQLVFGRPLSPAVHHLYAKHREQGTRPSLEDIYSILCSTIAQLSSAFIIVDALDEYPEDERGILLGHLSSLTAGSTTSLMLTSRPHININHVVENLQILEIRALEDDIRLYIDAAVLKSSRLLRHIENRSALREEIEEMIVQRSGGMFLLAKLHINSLTAKHTVKAVRNALNNMPDNLNSTYDEVVDRINRQSDDDKQLAWRTLSWVTNAKRPLRPAELREALAVEQGTKRLDHDNLLDMETILSVCAGLVVINEADRRLRLIHYTMQSYLDRVQSNIFPQAKMEITTTCITYLSFDTIRQNSDPMSLFRQNSLLDYAVEYCLIHARGEPEVQIKQSILSFLADCGPWWHLWNWRHTKQPKSNARLWIALLFHLEEICRDLMQEDDQIQEAALEGLTDIVKLLIDHGVDINAEGVNGTALYIASSRGNYDIVRLLIKHGADINIQDKKNNSALQAASSQGYKDIVSLLIEHGADINARGGEYGSALHAASLQGYKNIVSLLIEHGADINAQHRQYGSALYAASWRGYKDIVSLLIEHGADINARGGEYGSALHAASLQGYKNIVSLLIEHGADINAQHRQYGSALYAASFQGHKDIVSLLLEHGADINARGGEYGSALGAAAWAGHKDAVSLLIEHGADINAQHRQYGSALYAASWRGYKDIVSLLIEHGADINAQGGQYGSALQAASLLGYKDIISLLIEHSADVNVQGGEYGSALQAASFQGHKDIVSLLLEHGADINARGGEYGSALGAAVWAGHKDAVNLLLEHGAVKGRGVP
ncbi:ankyrin repeat-containing domain protein [Mycena latifolia]|nr:ankyrin repeat-containing domain protein [Mycena latifolia]